MTMRVGIQPLALEHYCSVSAGSCLTTLLKALISLQTTTTCLLTPKNSLGSQHFFSNVELMEGVNTWLSSQAADLFDTDTQKLFPQYDKCLTSGGDYVEK
jgi:hypothetical protein